MTDYSQLSDEELLKMAGISEPSAPSARDFSGWSDEDLLKAAGLSMPEAPNTRPSWTDSALQTGKMGLLAIAGLADMGLDVLNPMRVAERQLPEEARSSVSLRSLLDENIPDAVGGPNLKYVQSGLDAAVIPGGNAVLNAASGVTAELAEGLFPGSSLVGAVIPGLASKGLQTASNKLFRSGQRFERYSVGAGMSDYTKQMKKTGLMVDEESKEYVNKLESAINYFGEKWGWGFARTPQSLLKKAETVQQKVGKEIGEMVKQADNAQIVPNVQLANTQKLIDSATIDKEDLTKVLDEEFLGKFLSKDPKIAWDGTVENLHKWSRDIRGKGFSGEASKATQADRVRALQRAIGEDLQEAVKGAVQKSGVAPEAIEGAFKDYGVAATLMPLLKKEVGEGASGTLATLLRGALRTSGGTITTPILAGAAIGGGLATLPAAVVAAGLTAATTSTGSGLTGSVLKALGRLGKKAPGLKEGAKSAVAASIVNNRDIEGQSVDIKEGDSPGEDETLNGKGVNTMILNALGKFSEGKKPQPEVKTETPSSESSAPADQVSYMDPVESAIQEVAAAYELDPALLRSLAVQESSLNPMAISDKGAKGLVQLMDATAAQQAAKLGIQKWDIFDTKTNLVLGASYLKELIDKYGDVGLALTAYHSGPGTVDKLLAETEEKKLSSILPGLGPYGKLYASSILKRMIG